MKKGYVYAIVSLMFFCITGGPSYGGQCNKKYEITITNLTRGQILSPPIVMTHNRGFELFSLGDSAGSELAALAEEGDPSQLINLIDLHPGYNYAVSDGPVFPGETTVIEITAGRGARLISMAGMLVTTNDGFFAVRDLRIPFRGELAIEAGAYDAGTERNSEDCAFIPGPPCGSPNAHDPADAEGYVHIHAGIHGIGPDPEMVDPAMHDWRNPVARITVRRIH